MKLTWILSYNSHATHLDTWIRVKYLLLFLIILCLPDFHVFRLRFDIKCIHIDTTSYLLKINEKNISTVH